MNPDPSPTPRPRRVGLYAGIGGGAVVLVAATIGITLAATHGSSPKAAAESQTQAPATTAAALPTTAAPTSAAPSPTPNALKMGTKADATKVVATAYAWKQPVATKAPKPDQDGFEWGAADVEICSNIDSYISRISWRITYADHTTIDPSSIGYQQFPEPDYPHDDRAISPGQCVRGWITFPVPVGKKPATVQYQPQQQTFRADWAVS